MPTERDTDGHPISLPFRRLLNTTIQGDIISLNGQGQPTATLGDGVFIANSAGTLVASCTIQANRDWGILLTLSPVINLSLNNLANNGLGSVTTV